MDKVKDHCLLASVKTAFRKRESDYLVKLSATLENWGCTEFVLSEVEKNKITLEFKSRIHSLSSLWDIYRHNGSCTNLETGGNTSCSFSHLGGYAMNDAVLFYLEQGSTTLTELCSKVEEFLFCLRKQNYSLLDYTTVPCDISSQCVVFLKSGKAKSIVHNGAQEFQNAEFKCRGLISKRKNSTRTVTRDMKIAKHKQPT